MAESSICVFLTRILTAARYGIETDIRESREAGFSARILLNRWNWLLSKRRFNVQSATLKWRFDAAFRKSFRNSVSFCKQLWSPNQRERFHLKHDGCPAKFISFAHLPSRGSP